MDVYDNLVPKPTHGECTSERGFPMPVVNPVDLLVESFRITFFHNDPLAAKVNYFETVFEVAPNTRQVTNGPISLDHSEGMVGDWKYVVDCNQQFVNFVVMGSDQINPTTGEFIPELTYGNSIVLIQGIWAKLLESRIISASPRFGLAPIVFVPADGHEDGYTKLSQYLPFELNGKTSSDFLFQINHRSKHTLISGQDIEVNNLIHSAVSQIATFTIAQGGSGEPVFQPVLKYRSRLQFDINNVPGPLPLTLDQLKEISEISLINVLEILEGGIKL